MLFFSILFDFNGIIKDDRRRYGNWNNSPDFNPKALYLSEVKDENMNADHWIEDPDTDLKIFFVLKNLVMGPKKIITRNNSDYRPFSKYLIYDKMLLKDARNLDLECFKYIYSIHEYKFEVEKLFEWYEPFASSGWLQRKLLEDGYFQVYQSLSSMYKFDCIPKGPRIISCLNCMDITDVEQEEVREILKQGKIIRGKNNSHPYHHFDEYMIAIKEFIRLVNCMELTVTEFIQFRSFLSNLVEMTFHSIIRYIEKRDILDEFKEQIMSYHSKQIYGSLNKTIRNIFIRTLSDGNDIFVKFFYDNFADSKTLDLFVVLFSDKGTATQERLDDLVAHFLVQRKLMFENN